MPTYDYKCNQCNYIFEKRSSIADRLIPVGDPCPSCSLGVIERNIAGQAPEVCADAVRLGRVPIDNGFKEVLAKIHERTPGSNLNDMLSRNPNKYRI